MTDEPLQRGTPPGSLRYFAVLYAPEPARPLLQALYAFEAEIRDTVRATSHDVSHTRLQWWRGEVDRLVAGRPDHPVTRALLPLRAAGADVSLLHEAMAAADFDLARVAPNDAREVAALAFRSHGSIQSLAAAASSLPRAVTTAELEFARCLGDTIAGVEVAAGPPCRRDRWPTAAAVGPARTGGRGTCPTARRARSGRPVRRAPAREGALAAPAG